MYLEMLGNSHSMDHLLKVIYVSIKQHYVPIKHRIINDIRKYKNISGHETL